MLGDVDGAVVSESLNNSDSENFICLESSASAESDSDSSNLDFEDFSGQSDSENENEVRFLYEVRHDFDSLKPRADGVPWVKLYRAELGKLMTPYQAMIGWVNFVLGQRQDSKVAVARIIAADLAAQLLSDALSEFQLVSYLNYTDDTVEDDAKGPADGYPSPDGL